MKTGIRGLLIVFTLLFFGTTVQGSTTKQVDQYYGTGKVGKA